MNEDIPPTLGEAILTEPLWLQAWILLLVIANVGALLFVVHRMGGEWKVRREALAIIAATVVAGVIMDWMYASYGYVRLLGLAHLIGWTPAYVYVLLRRSRIGTAGAWGKYIHFYLAVAGLSLLIDAIDVVRYALGDGELYLRWAML